MNFSDVKLVIWDLDETFWKGTLSDNNAVLDQRNVRLVRDMVDAGVMCSICSKNELSVVREMLEINGLWDLFVFPSINWTPKGARVRQIIQSMNLREPNALFLDDNVLNREEVRSACPNMMVADVDVIPEMCGYYEAAEKKDMVHARLAQYRLLEQKVQFQAQAGSNEQFLLESEIRVEIGEDCLKHLDRIEDLILRSNQLNFTKLRSTRQELEQLLHDESVRCGYVQVRDKFGDYGITGFFAVQNDRLIHFTFSCRTLNMGVEQYVYELLDSPKLEIQGEVASDPAGPKPYWINRKGSGQTVQDKKTLKGGGKILIKGLCDMQQIFAFIYGGKNILTELVYVNDAGVSIESGCHTVHILESRTLAKPVAERMIQTLPFGDKDMFTTAMFDPDVSHVFLSLLTDPNLGLYQEKESGAVVAFGEYTNDLTDESIWPELMSKERFVANCSFTEENLRYIRERFTFLGRITPEQTVQNLDKILNNMASGAKLILLLGCELPYEKNVQPAYEDRHLYHKRLNDLVRQWADGKERVFLLDINAHIRGQSDFTNNINHYNKEIYYKLSKDLIDVINLDSGTQLRESTLLEQKLRRLAAIIRKIPQKARRLAKRLISRV